jgi:hypothetical protein
MQKECTITGRPSLEQSPPTESYDLSRERRRQPHEGKDVRGALSPPDEARRSIHRSNESPPSWMADSTTPPVCPRIAVLGPKYLLIIAFRVERRLAERARDVAARDPDIDKDETPRGQPDASVVKFSGACLVVRDSKFCNSGAAFLGKFVPRRGARETTGTNQAGQPRRMDEPSGRRAEHGIETRPRGADALARS